MMATPSYPSYSTGLFTDVWNPKKSPVRLVEPTWPAPLDYDTQCITPTLTLAGQTLTFADGHWAEDTAASDTNSRATPRGSSNKRPEASSEVQRLKKKVCDLEEENNALKLRVEVLLDMLTEAMAEVFVLEYTLKDLDEALEKRKKKRQEIFQ